jgi:hypothetical protein
MTYQDQASFRLELDMLGLDTGFACQDLGRDLGIGCLVSCTEQRNK